MNRGIKALILLGVLILMFVAGYYGFQVLKGMLFVQEVEVPDVVGLTEEEAVSVMKAAKINYVFGTPEYDPDVERGHVISTSPAFKQRIKVTSSVTIILSAGIEDIEVPNLANIELSAAETAIKNVKLELGTVSYAYSETIENNYVIDQSIKAKEIVEMGTIINLTVSKGKEPEKLLMEDYIGKKEDETKNALMAMNISLNPIKYEESKKYESGIVIAQDPKVGTLIDADSKVTLTVSTGPGPTQAVEQTVVIPLPLEPEELNIKIFATDNNGRREVYSAKKAPEDSPLVLKIPMTGSCLLEIYINGELYDRKTVISGD